MAAFDDALQSQAVRLREALVALAREDPNAFVSLVLRDEKTNKRVRQAPMHRVWQALLTKHDRAVLWSATESGKTQQISVGRVLWEIGRDPTKRIAVVSNTAGQAVKIARTLMQYIETSEDLHAVFPDLRPSAPWTTGKLFVQRPIISKDPSIQAFGVHGNVLGARLDIVILDDVLDYENTRTAEQRQQLHEWYLSALAGRLVEGGKVWVIGTAFHPDDVLHRFAKSWGAAYRYPVVDDAGQPRWPERWSLERIRTRAAELGPLETARQLYCQARDDSTSRFQYEWIRKCLLRGEGRELCYGLKTVPAGFKVYTGVDLAVQQHSAADLTVLFTVGVHPNGDREILNVESGRWAGPQIVARIIDHHRRYQGIAVVENNAAQDFILQFTGARSAVPLRAFTTGRNKAHPEFGVESLAAELAMGKWIIPNVGGRAHPEVEAWISEMLYYDPRAHVGDRLMASWFAREGARMGMVRAESAGLDLQRR